jgi:hypothetical protein
LPHYYLVASTNNAVNVGSTISILQLIRKSGRNLKTGYSSMLNDVSAVAGA